MNKPTHIIIIAVAMLIVVLLAIALAIVNGLEVNSSRLHCDIFVQANFDYRVAVTLFGRSKKIFVAERDHYKNTLRRHYV